MSVLQNFRLSITNKMLLIGTLIVISVSIMLVSEFRSIHHIEKLEKIRIDIDQIQIGMLLLRRNEKDFIARLDLKYQDKFSKNIEKIYASIDQVHQQLLDEGIGASQMQALRQYFEKYHEVFNRLVEEQKKLA